MCILCALASAVVLTACGSPPPPESQTNKPPSPEEVAKMLRSYPLRIGDRVRVELSGIPDHMDPLDRDVKDDGKINLPYIGDIPAAGKSPSQLEKDITDAYVGHYFVRVNVTVTPTARYYYVMGQVNNNGVGRIPYAGPISVLDAIAGAGGFNPFADKRHVQITRVNGDIQIVNCVKALKHTELDLKIYPGDRITVKMRSF